MNQFVRGKGIRKSEKYLSEWGTIGIIRKKNI